MLKYGSWNWGSPQEHDAISHIREMYISGIPELVLWYEQPKHAKKWMLNAR